MSTGGIFTLIANDGRQDRLLNSTAMLNRRLRELEVLRSENPNIKDSTPTLVDIERTHILFINAHFKPFASVGYEYNRVTPNSGLPEFNQEVSFAIPNLGDFFHDMALHVILSEATSASDDPLTQQNTLQYCSSPATKLAKKVKFVVNGNPLDEYDSEVMSFYQKFQVQPNKEIGWFRNVGQEVPYEGVVDTITPDVRQKIQCCDGPQTPKYVQPALEMWLPLLFWCNRDVRLSIPSVAIPYGQRFITFQLEKIQNLIQHPDGTTPGVNGVEGTPPEIKTFELLINNIFVEPEIHDIFIKRIGFTLIRVHRIQKNVVNTADEIVEMVNIRWPVETLYIGLRPQENNGTMEDWNKYHKVEIIDTELCALAYLGCFSIVDDALLVTDPVQWGQLIDNITTNRTNNFASPIDTKFTGLISYSQLNTGLNNYVQEPEFLNVATNTAVNIVQFNEYLRIWGLCELDTDLFADVTAPTPDEFLAALAATSQHCIAKCKKCVPTIDEMGISVHGIPLYTKKNASFYNSYIPWKYGGYNVRTPNECGALMVTFNFYPGSYQPSGHINISKAREFYITIKSSIIDKDTPGDFVVVAIALNFLLISDGSCILRFST